MNLHRLLHPFLFSAYILTAGDAELLLLFCLFFSIPPPPPPPPPPPHTHTQTHRPGSEIYNTPLTSMGTTFSTIPVPDWEIKRKNEYDKNGRRELSTSQSLDSVIPLWDHKRSVHEIQMSSGTRCQHVRSVETATQSLSVGPSYRPHKHREPSV